MLDTNLAERSGYVAFFVDQAHILKRPLNTGFTWQMHQSSCCSEFLLCCLFLRPGTHSQTSHAFSNVLIHCAFSNVLLILDSHGKCTKALTVQNFCQMGSPESGGDGIWAGEEALPEEVWFV